MPNKRSRHKKSQKFYCPCCQRRLWRVGSPKHYIFYEGREEIQKGFKLPALTAALLAAQNNVWVDRQVWLEEFFCEEHGKMWMRLFPSPEGLLWAQLAKQEDWQKTIFTLNPDHPQCGVSEFTYRSSRRSHPNLNKKYYE